MKKTNRILHWLTLFVASIGVCAFLSVCFILIYSKVFGSFSPKAIGGATPDHIAETHIDDNGIVHEKTNNIPTADSQEYAISDTHTDKIIELTQDKDTNEDFTSDGYDITESSVNKDAGEHAIPAKNTVNVTQSDSEQQKTPELPKESSVEITYIPESSSSDNSVEPAAESAGTSGNNNFNTYDNKEQQQGDDLYVLNTSSMKIHHKTCNSVRKIAPQNYSTSNTSVNELINQGYSLCGNCFK